MEVYELRLPSAANLALIVRDSASMVPGPTTVLRTGDRLLIVCPGERPLPGRAPPARRQPLRQARRLVRRARP